MLSPAETVRWAAPAASAAARSDLSTADRRETPPLMLPMPAVVGAGKSSCSGPAPRRWECSSLVWRMTSWRGALVLLQAKESAEMRRRVRRMVWGPFERGMSTLQQLVGVALAGPDRHWKDVLPWRDWAVVEVR